jgi:hypothetical protein
VHELRVDIHYTVGLPYAQPENTHIIIKVVRTPPLLFLGLIKELNCMLAAPVRPPTPHYTLLVRPRSTHARPHMLLPPYMTAT